MADTIEGLDGGTRRPRVRRRTVVARRRAAVVLLASALAGLLLVAVPARPAVAAGEGRFFPLTPSRILDTRTGNGAPAAMVGPGATVGLQVTGRGGVPASGVSAVAMNVTVTNPTATSWLTAWPAGEALPLASNLNYTPGQTVPNLVVVKVGADGVVNLRNAEGQVHVLADVVGWFDDGTGEQVVDAGDFFFDPDVVTGPAGSTVTVRFRNIGSEDHTFTATELGIDRSASPGEQVVFSFQMPSSPVQFFCSIHFREGMTGTIQPS